MPLAEYVPATGGFIKPEELSQAHAILVTVTDFELQVPSVFGPKDTAVVDLTVFRTEAELDAGQPSDNRQGVRINQTVLAGSLKKYKGDTIIVTLKQAPATKPGQRPAWVWEQASGAVKQKAAAFYKAREAAIQAELANAPSFD